MVTQSDYSQLEVQSCFSVLVEIMTVLGEFRDNIVIVGGNVPPLLIPSAKERYSGTLDIDLAIDNKHITNDTYRTIVKLLKSRGYYQKEGEQPFIFLRDIDSENGQKITIQVDLLSGEFGGTGKQHRHQNVQDAQARKARGCDLVFNKPLKVKLKGTLPNGAINEVTVQIPSIGAFLVTKGMALWNRLKEKDAYDIYYCCRYYPGGLDALVKNVKPIINSKLAKEGLGKIKTKFIDINAVGPIGVADFKEIRDKEEGIVFREKLLNG